MHVRIAERWSRAGDRMAAFLELARAAEVLPLTARLASALVTFGSECGAQSQVQKLLHLGAEDAEGDERLDIMRQCARLALRAGRPADVAAALKPVFHAHPYDVRASAMQHAALFRLRQWDELDALLDAQSKAWAQRKLFHAAARVCLRRARLCFDIRLQPAKAAQHAQKAAQYAAQGQDERLSFFLRRYAEECGAPTSPQEVAEAARSAGYVVVAAALASLAWAQAGESSVFQDIETTLLANAAWAEMVALYRSCLVRHPAHPSRVLWATRLAELLESERRDFQGAAEAWGLVAEESKDALAQAEVARLWARLGHPQKAKAALDANVAQALSSAERVLALMARAEDAVARDERANARVDFEAVVKLSPFHPGATAGLAELAMDSGDLRAIGPFEHALSRLPSGTAGRAEYYRRLARVADALKQHHLSLASWREVLSELPKDDEATAQMLKRVRGGGDDAALERMLRAALEGESSHPRARALRMELVTLHERCGRPDEARLVLREAVAVDAAHREAWLTLVERLLDDGAPDAEVVDALERAAAATEDAEQRALLWHRLARYLRTRRQDEARAAVFEARAGRLSRELTVSGVRRLKRAIGRRGPSADELDRLAQRLGARLEPQQKSRAHVRIAPQVQRQLASFTGEMLAVRPGPPVPTGEMEEVTGELQLADEVTAPPRPTPVSAPKPGRNALFEKAREEPLSPQVYRALSAHYKEHREEARAQWMDEMATALEGAPLGAHAAPRLLLNVTERASLLHPSLRGEGGDLLRLVGLVLCRLDPMRGQHVGGTEALTAQSGRGAPGVIQAVRSAVRVLGVRAPEVYVSAESGPPISLVFTSRLRLVVGQLAVSRPLHDGELRFFAARALLTSSPELLALRTLRKEQLARAMALVTQVAEGKGSPLEMKLFREAVPPAKWSHFKQLAKEVAPSLALSPLYDGARHTLNRAGLVVSGAVSPALASLKAKRARPEELIELVRFAASDRYFALRAKSL